MVLVEEGTQMGDVRRSFADGQLRLACQESGIVRVEVENLL
jgi:hypothetical protein